MKKLVLALALFAGVVSVKAQDGERYAYPQCNNTGMIDGIVSSEAAQGWKLSSTSYQPIYYFVAPEAPYQMGTLTLSFVPDCGPNELCIQIIKATELEVVVTNDNAGCLYKK